MTENPFLQEVLKAPEDDIPRLIYADWLDEQGDPRGEFIRVQCELAQTTALEPEYYDLEERSAALLTEHQQAWATEVKQDVRKAEFHRGFIDTITITAKNFVNQGEALFAATPVHWLRLNLIRNYGERLAATPALASIQYLDLGGLKIEQEELLAILRSPYLANLRGLKLYGPDWMFFSELGRALADSSFATVLETLDIRGEGYGYGSGFFSGLDSGIGFPKLKELRVGAYIGSGYAGISKLPAPHLESLSVGGNVRSDDLKKLSELPLNNLKRLDLSGTGAPAKGIQFFLDTGIGTQLEHLDLSGCTLSERLLKSLFSGENLKNCKYLNLSRAENLQRSGSTNKLLTLLHEHSHLEKVERLFFTDLDEAGLEILGRCEQLRNVKQLEVSESDFNRRGMQSLVRGGLLKKLRRLTLQGRFAENAFAAWENQNFPKLFSLYLIGGWSFEPEPFPDEATFCRLLTTPTFPEVRVLSLAFCGASERTLSGLADAGELPELRQLLFDGNTASSAAVRELMTSDRCKKLACLSLSYTRGLSQTAKLAKEFPGRIRFRD